MKEFLTKLILCSVFAFGHTWAMPSSPLVSDYWYSAADEVTGPWSLVRDRNRSQLCEEELSVRLETPVGPSEFDNLMVNRIVGEQEESFVEFIDLNGRSRVSTVHVESVVRTYSKKTVTGAFLQVDRIREYCYLEEGPCHPWRVDDVEVDQALFKRPNLPSLILRLNCSGEEAPSEECEVVCLYRKASLLNAAQ